MPNYTLETQRGKRLTIESDSPENAMRLADRWDLEDHAASEAQKAGVSPDLVLRQIQQESGGNQNAVSPKGAGGMMQLMPATAKELGVDASDPYQNISGGVRYLKQQMDAFGGDEAKALAAYNAGPAAVRKYGGVPPYAETQAYVKALAGKSQPLAPAPTSPPAAARPGFAPGMKALGNLDPNQRPILHNPDGGYSTTSSISIGTDQGETLIPTVVNGKRLTNDQAIAHFKQTGEHFGVFDTPDDADRYATALHNRQDQYVQAHGGPDKFVPQKPATGAEIAAAFGVPPQSPVGAAPKPVSQLLGLLEGIKPAVTRLAPYSPANLIPGFREANAASLERLSGRIAEREKTATPGKAGEFAGNVATTAWLPGGPMVNGALTGAVLSQSQNPAEVVRDAAYGAFGGKFGSSVMGGAGKMIAGVTGDALKLANKGVPLTLGQMAGGSLRKVEDSLTSVPVVGDMIRSAQRRGLEGVNRAAYNDTLAHLGEKLPDEINIGRDAYNYTKQRLSDAYDEVLAPLVVVKDAPWTAAVGAAKSAAGRIGDKSVKSTVNDILKTEVLSRFDKAGKMTGEELKAAQEALTGHINDLSQGTKWSRDAAGVLRGLKSDLEGLVTRVDPEAGRQLAKVNRAYSFLKPLENAAAKPSSKDGIFTMPQLSMGAAAGKSKATLAAGKAPHQDLADAARLLPSTVPDSGSAGRLFTGAGATGLMGLLGGHLPVVGPAALPAAGLIGGTALAYTRRGQEALTKLLTRRPEVARIAGKQVRRLAAPAGAAGAVATVSGARQ